MKNVILFWLLLVITFLISAKTHGRQHRLERELHGYWKVSFVSENDPWIEKFWLQQRILYWSIAAVTAGFFVTQFIKKKRLSNDSPHRNFFVPHAAKNPFAFLIFAVGVSMIFAFVLTGVVSAFRMILEFKKGVDVPGEDWLYGAIWGSAGFWLLNLVSVVSLILFLKREVR